MTRMRLPRLKFFCLAVGLLACGRAVTAAAADTNPVAALPATTPWQLDRLREAPEFEWVDGEAPVRSLLYRGEPYQGRPSQVFAYYATPETISGSKAKTGKSLPAVVLVHGGGGTAFREWAELWARKGYAAIAMDLAGHRPIEGENAHDPKNRTPLEQGGPGQGDEEKFGSIDKPPQQQWPYHAVANVLLAHSLVRSFAEVDPERTAVTGISWGGYLTCIVAGVDNRFKVAVPVYGCGLLAENSAWLDHFARMTPEQRERWVTLWDPAQYLPAVSMPLLMVNGTNDFAYPLDSYMKCYERVPSFKQLCITVNMPHGHPAGWAPQEIFLFIDQHLRGGTPLARVGELTTVEGQVQAAVQSEVPIEKAALHWTVGTENINQRQWQTAAARWEDGRVHATAPPREATAWFLTVTDQRGAIVSSTVHIKR